MTNAPRKLPTEEQIKEWLKVPSPPPPPPKK